MESISPIIYGIIAAVLISFISCVTILAIMGVDYLKKNKTNKS
ncbi:hypothetical protein [Elizabethkingia anophelis]|nr:hypothetical protein [Elizabethkingia anophelis]